MGRTMSRQLHSGSPRPAEHEDGRGLPRLRRRDFMLGGPVLLCCGCATAPVTGRRQFIAISPEMAKLPGQRPPEFLSTHPEPESRLVNIKQHLPQAMAAYGPHPDPGDTPLPSPHEITGPTR